MTSKQHIHLFPFQSEMVNRIAKSFETNRSVMVQMPTGTGKTHIIGAIARSYISKGHTVFVIAHRRELVAQAQNTLQLYIDENGMKKVEVFSVQWLNRHVSEVKSKPSLIVIDEAHHSVAKTYTSIIEAFPKAKIMGLTATPCRLNGHPFTDLFDVLLQSHPINWFIANGYLSLYDYMSVKPDNEDVRIINSLRKRGADGDFSMKEMSEKLDIRPSLERLCDTITRYAKGKKGIVYAIDINHAEHIAELYQKNGIKAIAISSKTPDKEREEFLERFRNTQTDGSKPLKAGDIQVIVNVSLFDEGLDCPDVEFIQMARPTLSLSKYLQMVGRGLRVYDGKKYCLILDNVGNYLLFGLPSDDRDWEAMFAGSTKGKGDIKSPLFKSMDLREETTDGKRTEMVSILTHHEQITDLEVEFGYAVFQGDDGRYGVRNKNGEEVVPAIYKEIKLYPNAIVRVSKHATSRPIWLDVINLVPFKKRPTIIRSGWLELTTVDNTKFYPRVVTHEMNVDSYTNSDVLNAGIEDGLRFKNFYIQPTEPRKLYKYIEKSDSFLLFADEEGNLFMKEEYRQSLKPITREQWQEKKNEALKELDVLQKGVANGTILKEEHCIVDIGFLRFDKYGNYYRLHDNKLFFPTLFRAVAIRLFGKVCFLGNDYIIVEGHSHEPFKIIRKYIDGHRFLVRYFAYGSSYNSTYEADLYFDGEGSYKLTNKKWLGYLTEKVEGYLGYYYL
nr:DEAD/DEAH box helicase [uncultured Prevotella sp.]